MKYLLSLFMLLSIVSINAMEENLNSSESSLYKSVDSTNESVKTFVANGVASTKETVNNVVDAAKDNVVKAEGKIAKFGKSVKAKFSTLRGKTPTFASIKNGVKNSAHNVVAKIKTNPKKSAAILAVTVATVAAVVVCVKKYQAKKAKAA